MYKQQLGSYLRTYTEGNLNTRVVKTEKDEIRELVAKGKHKNNGRVVKVVIPQRATSKPGDLENIFTEWRHTMVTVQQDENYELKDLPAATRINPGHIIQTFGTLFEALK